MVLEKAVVGISLGQGSSQKRAIKLQDKEGRVF